MGKRLRPPDGSDKGNSANQPRGGRQASEAIAEPLRIVAIGGGTGLSTVLHGLKTYVPPRLGREAFTRQRPTVDITAVVTVTDDGGSSGRLRREFGVPPPGDIRNCMTALAGDEGLITRLFQYRFDTGHGLKGHSFGNLFLTALTNVTGSFADAVRFASEVLAISGRIYPSTESRITLEATLEGGRTVRGETRISRCKSRIRSIALAPADCRPLPATLEALARADLICLGPGSLYTSVIPNLLVNGIASAIRSSPALKAYIVNLMWQARETMFFKASDHLRPLLEHAGGRFLDYVIANDAPFSEPLLERYRAEGAEPVENDFDELERLGVRVLSAPLLDETSGMIRHDPATVAAIVVTLAQEGRRRKHLLETSTGLPATM